MLNLIDRRRINTEVAGNRRLRFLALQSTYHEHVGHGQLGRPVLLAAICSAVLYAVGLIFGRRCPAQMPLRDAALIATAT